MKAKKFFKLFKWSTLVPALFTLVAGILFSCIPTGDAFALEIGAGVLFLVSGILAVVGFLLDHTGNPVALLAGVSQLAVMLWLFISAPVGLYVLCIALAVIVAVRSASEVYEAVVSRKAQPKKWIARIVFAAAFVALAVTVAANPFESAGSLCVTAGVALLGSAFFGIVFELLSGGFFYEEEELRFRPAKKK